METNHNRPTGLRPPTQFSASTRGLHEITESQSNARSQPSSLLPSITSGIKRPVPAPASQSAAKRGTLAQAAGEYPIKRGPYTSNIGRSQQGSSLKDLVSLEFPFTNL
ncbi:hypothetical protein F5Y15DRAFT_93347 [Xylariaceae sp. FL0016]|nr:hypothetical protein F5Y15DRAFT_93347 [Xylariaceae sp. FL0016]